LAYEKVALDLFQFVEDCHAKRVGTHILQEIEEPLEQVCIILPKTIGTGRRAFVVTALVDE
jgi:hypothetical protein